MESIRNKWNGLEQKTRGKVYFVIAILTEIIADFFLKYSEGCTVLWATVLCAALLLICFVCFAKALVTYNLGYMYAVWSGAGILFLAAVSVLVFRQGLNLADIVGLALIIFGIAIMNVFGSNEIK
ncbi:MAG: multidrug efflux SMR transporter [Firmicutes bacterium]|nr:multidrug efflux SMR transporter [Bacillota bacterium]